MDVSSCPPAKHLKVVFSASHNAMTIKAEALSYNSDSSQRGQSMSDITNFQYDIFLSHSSKDKVVVRDVAERLKQDGLRVWFGEWEIKPRRGDRTFCFRVQNNNNFFEKRALQPCYVSFSVTPLGLVDFCFFTGGFTPGYILSALRAYCGTTL